MAVFLSYADLIGVANPLLRRHRERSAAIHPSYIKNKEAIEMDCHGHIVASQ